MDLLLGLFALQGTLGAFDTLYHHELTERLTWRPSAGPELRIHALRNLIYGVIFLTLACLEWRGVMAIVLAALLVVEILITLWDFVIEDRTRRLPASERVTHTLLAVGYGVILALFVPVLVDWAQRPSAVAFVDRGWLAWVMGLFAAGAFAWGLRDFARSRRLSFCTDRPAKELAAQLDRRHAILVTGGTGFVGRRLCRALIDGGHDVTVLTRNRAKVHDLLAGATAIESLDETGGQAAFDAIVNLAGEPLATGRWTRAKTRRLLDSRIEITSALVRLIASAAVKPRVLVSGSAVGFYGGDEHAVFSENSPPGASFSHELCRAWEAAAREIEAFGVRVCLLRTGIVLGRTGGALGQMLLPFDFGLGGPLGHGRQWISWIHRDDLVRLIVHLIATDGAKGPINATAPLAVRNRDFAAALGRALHRPTVLPLPGPVLRLLLGQMADEILLTGQKVLPEKAWKTGFRFDFPDLASALEEIVGKTRKREARDRRWPAAAPRDHRA
jgi:uncharacterized protein (TIGR01777 family)